MGKAGATRRDFRTAPIRVQLTVFAVLASGIALAVAGVGFMAYDLTRVRQEMVDDISLLGSTISYHCRAPLSFDDRKAARETLQALEIHSPIRLACIFGEGDLPFACYRPQGSGAAGEVARPSLEGIFFEEDALIFAGPIVLGDRQIGRVYLESDLREIRERRAAYFAFTALLLLASFGGAVLFASRLQRIISDPIIELAETARAISEGRDYSVRARGRGAGELGLLIDGFNVMLAEIEKRETELVAEIRERERAEKEREHLIQELERRNVEMERFTYTVSHDLKTPLITIKGFLGLLARDLGSQNPERVEEDMERIDSAASRMHSLLENLLELSQIGRVINPPEEVSLSVIAEEAVSLVAGAIDSRGVEVSIEPDLPTLVGDRPRLVEVLQNLIENAVKFMEDQPVPRVEITGEDDGEMVLCTVRDNGVGIDSRYLDTVFGLFNRLTSKGEGTGVGLALVKRIVEAHGGRAWVESEGPGRGSAFSFSIPRNPPAAESAET
jgi:signal transduction histidine kinase